MKHTSNTTWELIWMLAKTDFKLRYYGSVLGVFWAFLKPLLIFLVLNFVFSSLFAGSVPHFSVKLLLGIILFTFFSEGTMAGMLSLVSKAHILKKIKIQKWIIILSSTLYIFFSFLINIFIVVLFMVFDHIIPSGGDVLLFLMYILELYGVIIAFSLVTSVVYVHIRDLNQIWEVLLTILFYASPIIYPLSIIPEQYHIYFFLNPLTFIIEHSKEVLIDHTFSSFDKNMLMLSLVFIVLLCTFILFPILSRRINEKL